MKDMTAGVALLIVLIIFFSCLDCYPIETPMQNGLGAKHKGDSGLIVPGDGELLADTNIEPESMPELPQDERTVESKVTEVTEVTETEHQPNFNKTSTEETTKKIKEKNKMDVIAFWHGVAAVLIGETSALMVAVAWMKIRGGKDA